MSVTTERFPRKLPRSTKRSRGRTRVESTPVAIRGHLAISPTVVDRIRRKLVRRIGHAAALFERGTIRFEDLSGTRGGINTECRIKLVLSGRPSIQVVERAGDLESAFDGAAAKVQRALARVRGKHELATGRQRTPARRARQHVAKKAVRRAAVHRVRPSTRRAVGASRRSGHPAERNEMKLVTARPAPSRKKVTVKAKRAKRRVGVQRASAR
jgi:ribosome-associated translation inhibitor RaiA